MINGSYAVYDRSGNLQDSLQSLLGAMPQRTTLDDFWRNIGAGAAVTANQSAINPRILFVSFVV